MLYTSTLCFQLSPNSDQSLPVDNPELRHILDKGYKLYWIRNLENRNQAQPSLVLDHPSLNFVFMLNPEELAWDYSNSDPEKYLWQKLFVDFPALNDAVQKFRSVFGKRPFHFSNASDDNKTNVEGIFTSADKWQMALRFESLPSDSIAELKDPDYNLSNWEGPRDQSVSSLLQDAAALQQMIDIVSDKRALLTYLKTVAVKEPFEQMPLVIETYSDDDLRRDEHAIEDVFRMSLNGACAYSLDYFYVEVRIWKEGNTQYLKIRPFYAESNGNTIFSVSPDNLVQLGGKGLDINWTDGTFHEELVYLYTAADLGVSLGAGAHDVFSTLLARSNIENDPVDVSVFDSGPAND